MSINPIPARPPANPDQMPAAEPLPRSPQQRLSRDTIHPQREVNHQNHNQISFWDRPLYAKVGISIGALFVTPIYLAKKAILATPDLVAKLANNVVFPVINKIGDASMWLHKHIVSPAIENILIPVTKFAFITIPDKIIKNVIKPLYNHVLKPVYKTLEQAWDKHIRPALAPIRDAAIRSIKFAWKKAIYPTLDFIVTNSIDLASHAYNLVFVKAPKLVMKGLKLCEKALKPAWNVAHFAFSKVGNVVSIAWGKALYPYAVKPMLDRASWAAAKLTDNILKPALNHIAVPLAKFAFVTMPNAVYHSVIVPVENALSHTYTVIKNSIVELFDGLRRA